MKFQIFLTWLFLSCSIPNKGLYRDHDRCELILKDDTGVERVISLANLPLPTEIKHHQGLWCDNTHIQASLFFNVYDEKWALVFMGDKELNIKVNPYGEEGHIRAKSWSQDLAGDKGCKIIQKPGVVFSSDELISKNNHPFYITFHCKNND